MPLIRKPYQHTHQFTTSWSPSHPFPYLQLHFPQPLHWPCHHNKPFLLFPWVSHIPTLIKIKFFEHIATFVVSLIGLSHVCKIFTVIICIRSLLNDMYSGFCEVRMHRSWLLKSWEMAWTCCGAGRWFMDVLCYITDCAINCWCVSAMWDAL